MFGFDAPEAPCSHLNCTSLKHDRMDIVVDDVGSFPLPPQVDRSTFDKAYVLARKAIVNRKDIANDDFLLNNFHKVIVDSFSKKLATGLDVVNYPQHYDMQRQLADTLKEAVEKGTYLIEESQAFLPEVHVIKEEAKRFYEELGKTVPLRVCILGPMEFYLREIGTAAYADVLSMFAKNVKRFAKNSVLDSKYIKTTVISLDEPSFGFREISASKDVIIDLLEEAFDFNGPVKQIHLHSPSRMTDVLEIKNIDVLSFEYAASPRNIESVSRRMLEQADKHIRVGIARTDIDSITAELYDKGITKPQIEQLAEDKATIQKRFAAAREKYGDRMTYTGPDCGLGGWPTQESALLLLKRTVEAVRDAKET
jgi:5-methyltetrahydropteroyltriglutamate--homocysteine methyltransferase